MKTVYRFKVYDINNDEYKTSENYATEEYILKIKEAIILTETKKEVPLDLLDSFGRLLTQAD
jgi:hypothetical protein